MKSQSGQPLIINKSYSHYGNKIIISFHILFHIPFHILFRTIILYSAHAQITFTRGLHDYNYICKHIASSPGCLGGWKKGLVHTVCAYVTLYQWRMCIVYCSALTINYNNYTILGGLYIWWGEGRTFIRRGGQVWILYLVTWDLFLASYLITSS